MAERAILTGLVALVLLTALAKMGPSLTSSFERVSAKRIEGPAHPIDHQNDEHRAHKVLEAYNLGPDEEENER